jgi:hypothetical protein
LGLKLSREQAAALFLRHGCDAQGLLPYEVFAAKLQVWQGDGWQLLGCNGSCYESEQVDGQQS